MISADDTGLLRVMNFPCAVECAPSADHRAHSSHVSAARGSWCDQWVASAGGRDCCVMQWRVVRAAAAGNIRVSGDASSGDGFLASGAGVGGRGHSRARDSRVGSRGGGGMPVGVDGDARELEHARACGHDEVELARPDEDYDRDGDGGDDGGDDDTRSIDAFFDEDTSADGVVLWDVGRRGSGATPSPRSTSGGISGGIGGGTRGTGDGDSFAHSKTWKMREEVAARRQRLEKELAALGHGRLAPNGSFPSFTNRALKP